jgi:hypothetical protein
MTARPLALLLTLSLLATLPQVSHAEPPTSAPSCGQKGRVVFDKDTLLTDGHGHNLARFSGGESAVALLAPPAGGSDQVKIETGTGRGSFRLLGFVKTRELRVFTAYMVPVVAGHVWINLGARVTLAGSSGGRIQLEKQMSTPFNQRFSAWADCSALTFAPQTPSGFSVPGSARVYLMKVALLDLYEDAGGSILTTLQRSPAVDSVRFFSTEQRGGFVHIQYQGEVSVDGWAKSSDLVALPKGETSDVWSGGYTLTSPPQLQLKEQPRTVRTTRELPLRLAAKEAEPPVGVVEPDTDVYVMDTVQGWANVLPKSLHILPVGEQSFWVKQADLGPQATR